MAAVKISSVRRKAARKFWAPQQGHPSSPARATLPALRATFPYTGEAFLLAPLRKGKSPKRCQWQKKRGDFEEVPRLAATTVAANRLARRWAGCHGFAVTEGSTTAPLAIHKRAGVAPRAFRFFMPQNPSNRFTWLVSAIPAKAPRAFSCSIWVLDSLLQHMENSSTEMKVLPLRFSTVSWAAASPSP